MAPRSVVVGDKFDRLTVLEVFGRSRGQGRGAKVRCECGVEKVVRVAHLRDGNTRSCGCMVGEAVRERSVKHGQTPRGRSRKSEPYPPTYNSWKAMRQRCRDPKNQNYERYGGRGITVCARWNGKDGFVNFLADMGERPEGHTIDRIDNNGPYSPENCRWASTAQQANNKRPRQKSSKKP